ncbi:MAG TPA: MFS transporter, partial [Burkholderiales bacterium]|nr:MFS transporter [Burkholderiales bacterium]
MHLIIPLCIAIHSCYIGSKVVISLLALEFGASQVVIGVIAALYALVPLVLGVYSGRLADTIGMRIPLFVGAVLVGSAMLVGHFWHSLSALFVTASLVGAGFVFFNVSIQNLTGTHGSPEQHVRNFSLLSIGYSTSTFIGPMVAGFVIDYAGHAAAFLVFAVFTLLPITVLAVNRNFAKFEGAVNREVKRSAVDLLRMPTVRRLIIISGLIVAATDLFAFYVPIYAHSSGLTASHIGIILGTYAVAAFVPRFTLPLMIRRWAPDRVLLVAMLVGATGFLAF